MPRNFSDFNLMQQAGEVKRSLQKKRKAEGGSGVEDSAGADDAEE